MSVLLVSCAGDQPPAHVETVADGLVHIVHVLRDPPDVEAHSDKFGLNGSMVNVAAGVDLFTIEEGEGAPIVLLNGRIGT